MNKKWKGKRARILKEFQDNPLITRACQKIGIARSTYYRWYTQDAEFRSDVDSAQKRGREKLTDFAESKLLENIRNNQYASIAYWLSHNTTRYRAYPKNVYTDEIRQLRMAEKALEEIGGMLARDAGYEALKRLVDDEVKRIDRESPLRNT